MAAALDETPVSYEDLEDLEREFDTVETEISTFGLRFRADGSPNYNLLTMYHSSPTGKPHSPSLRAPRQSPRPDPKLLAVGPRAGTTRH